jgi:hypothetical protein
MSFFSYRTETDFEYCPFVQEYLENLGIEYRYDFCLTRIFLVSMFSSADNKPFYIYYWLAVVDHSYLSLSESKPCVFVLFYLYVVCELELLTFSSNTLLDAASVDVGMLICNLVGLIIR